MQRCLKLFVYVFGVYLWPEDCSKRIKKIASCWWQQNCPFSEVLELLRRENIRFLYGESQIALKKQFYFFFIIFQVAESINKICSIKNIDFRNAKIHTGGLARSPDCGGKPVLFDAWSSNSSGVGMNLGTVQGRV